MSLLLAIVLISALIYAVTARRGPDELNELARLTFLASLIALLLGGR